MSETHDELVAHRGLAIHVQRDGGQFSLLLKGELDMDNAATLDEQLELAERSDAKRIVLDLRQLRFIDSSGLRSILIAARRSQQDHNRLGILRGSGNIAELLELTAIDQSINLLD